MGAYKDESNGTWYAKFYYTDWTGERHQTTKRGFDKKSEAQAYELEFKKKKKSCLDMTLASFVEKYFSDKEEQIKDRSYKTKKQLIDTHIIPYLGNRKMNDITSADITEWQKVIRKKDFSQCYQHMIQNQLRALFNHADRIYKLYDNPMKNVDPLGKAERDKHEMEFWTVDEYEDFIDTINTETMFGLRKYTMLEILFWTGMRIGELLALTKADIDTKQNIIYVSKTYHRAEKKDITTTPKTNCSIRKIEIPEFLTEEIEKYYKVADPNGWWKLDDRIFEITHRAMEKSFSELIAKSGAKKIRIHDLRHSHVAYLISQGEEISLISKRIGHKSVTVTWDTYGHLYPDAQKDLASRLNDRRKKK